MILKAKKPTTEVLSVNEKLEDQLYDTTNGRKKSIEDWKESDLNRYQEMDSCESIELEFNFKKIIKKVKL